MSIDVAQRSLRRLQQQFEQIGAGGAAVRCRLVHGHFAVERHPAPDADPDFLSGNLGGYGVFGIPCDDQGNPLFPDALTRVSNGERIGCRAPRNIVFHGGRSITEKQQCVAFIGRWRNLAEQAGRCLETLAGDCTASLPLDSLLESNRWLRWLYCVFDLAWQKRHPMLEADRYLVFRSNEGTAELPYRLDYLRMLPAAVLATLAIPAEWLEALPDSYESELNDAALASAAAIDLLLSGEHGAPRAYSKHFVGNTIDDPTPKMTSGQLAIAIWGRAKVGGERADTAKRRVLDWMKEGRLPANRIGRGWYVVSKSALDALAKIEGGALDNP